VSATDELVAHSLPVYRKKGRLERLVKLWISKREGGEGKVGGNDCGGIITQFP